MTEHFTSEEAVALEKIAQSTFNAQAIAGHALAMANVATTKQERTESILIDGNEYTVPAPVAAEILRLHLENLGAIQERDAIYDLMDSKRKYMEELRGALVYHMEQTRPIQRSINAIAAGQQALEQTQVEAPNCVWSASSNRTATLLFWNEADARKAASQSAAAGLDVGRIPVFGAHPQSTEPAPNPWKDAVLNQLAAHCMDAPKDATPADILERIICMAVLMATDPAINEPAPSTAGERAELVEKIRAVIEDNLTCMYACTRVWEAWSVGTMSQDDFVHASETEFAEDTANSIHALLAAAPQPKEPK